MTKINLSQKPSRTRLQSLAAAASPVKPDRAGGKFAAGLLPGVSAITKGEALGHGFWIDEVFLQSVANALTAADGSKCRFTHPGLCADGLAKGLGLAFGGKLAGEQVLTDLHFYKSAHRSPDGDLAGYILDRAEEDPIHFGTSIVFISDWEAEKEFMLANGGRIEIVDDGWGSYETIVDFKSPDAANVDNLPHARLFEFLAVDVVDDPAANPGGLFHRDLSTIQAAESVLDYALGLSNERPTTVSLGADIDVDRARQFFRTYAASRGLSVSIEEFDEMFKLFRSGKLAAGTPKPTEKLAETPPTETPPAEKPGEPAKPKEEADQGEGTVTCPKCGEVFTPPNEDAPEPIAEQPQTPAEYAAGHARYVAEFGAEAGSRFFLGGVKFEAALRQHFAAQLAAKDQQIGTLQAQLTEANARLAAVANSGAVPLERSAPPAGTEGKKGGAAGVLFRSAK